jgi:hypothetical protein
MGFAEAGRVLGQPPWVLSMGLAAVLGHRSVQAAQQGDRDAARAASRLFATIMLLLSLPYLALVGFAWSWSPLTRLLPNAYHVPHLLLILLIGNIVIGMDWPYRAELLGAGRASTLARLEATANLVRAAIGATAGVIGAFAIPIGYIALALVRSAGYRFALRSLYTAPIGGEGSEAPAPSSGVGTRGRSARPVSMPNFLMIGAAKAGTSSLYAYLRQHPDVFLSEVRECDFFALEGERPSFTGPGDGIAFRRYITTVDRYQKLFRRAAERRAVGESSDLYLYSPVSCERIRRYLPDVKLIVVLRNPVDRAYSQYKHLVRDGREPLATFEQALAAEESRIASGWHPIWHLKARGFYSAQLAGYLDVFPRDRIAVHLYDDFVAEPRRVLRALYEFLDVDPGFAPDMSLRYNVSGSPRSRLLHAFLARPLAVKDAVKPLLPAPVRHRLRAKLMNRNIVPDRSSISRDTRQALVALYREDILRLQALINRDLCHWLES